MRDVLRPRRLQRVANPLVEPISVLEAKTFLRIDGDDEDALLTDMIAAARLAAEEQTGKSLITQSWQIAFDSSPPPVVQLPFAPIQSVTSVITLDEAGDETVISPSHYYLNALEELVFNAIPMGHMVRIRYVAGYGDAASDVPTDMAQAMLLHVAHLFEHRDSMTPPLAAQLCYANYREVRL